MKINRDELEVYALGIDWHLLLDKKKEARDYCPASLYALFSVIRSLVRRGTFALKFPQ
jgi:hypothetical protein